MKPTSDPRGLFIIAAIVLALYGACAWKVWSVWHETTPP